MGSNQKGSNATSYPDQSPFNYTISQAATSYARSMSDIIRKRLDRDEDEQSKASVYSSYAAAQEDRQIRRVDGRVRYVASDCILLKEMPEGLQYAERDLLSTFWYGVL
jgi:hypothetical protein